MCRFFLFSSIDLLKTSLVLKKHFNPTGGGGGGHKVMDSG